MTRPIVSWMATVLVMAPLVALGLHSSFVQDVMTEMPKDTPSVKNLRWLATKFDVGTLAPLSVLLDSDSDLRTSEGLALIDDVSELLTRQRRIREVRSATQPLGSTAPLDPARLSERLRLVNAGHSQMEAGSRELQKGLNEGAAKLRTALWFERRTGIPLTGSSEQTRQAIASNLRQAWASLRAEPAVPPRSDESVQPDDPRNVLVRELTRAADGARRIADGAAQAHSRFRRSSQTLSDVRLCTGS